jgi:nucleoside phosphorylase
MSIADVLLVAVTEVESRAILKLFGHPGGTKDSRTIDGRVYTSLGLVNNARVILAISEMGSGGVGGSQQTVNKAIAALKPNCVIFVGIAFGVDDSRQAIGDVLVSQQLSLYELQRMGKEIRMRGDRPHASPKLVNFCKVTSMLAGPETSGKIRFGLLLTGEKLIDDIDYRNELRAHEPEAIGGEMEGGGMYAACYEPKVDWIVVKSICDWADGNKSNPRKDEFQEIAATNAAAFVHRALKSADFVASGSRVESTFDQREVMLLLRLHDYEGTCLIRKSKGESEHLWVPGSLGGVDMQWGAASNDDRLAWIYTVDRLLQKGLLEPATKIKEFGLSPAGTQAAWKLSMERKNSNA